MVCLFSREWASAVARAASRARARDSLPGIVLQRYIRLGYNLWLHNCGECGDIQIISVTMVSGEPESFYRLHLSDEWHGLMDRVLFKLQKKFKVSFISESEDVTSELS